MLPGHVVLLLSLLGCTCGLLYPKESESREVKELDKVWHFRADFSPSRREGFDEEWYKQPLQDTGDTIMMPVPSSFNDITQNVSLRDFVGWVWYDREFWVPQSWTDGKTRVVLRFESAHYNCIVWVNGQQVMNHSGGHLPFEAEVTNLLKAGVPNRVTAAVNNTLTPHTLPPGFLSFYGPPGYPEGYFVQILQFDFFNYAGIHRPVKLYTTPLDVHIDDITVTTSIFPNGSAVVDYVIVINSTQQNFSTTVTLKGRMAKEKMTASSVAKPRMCSSSDRHCTTGLNDNQYVVKGHVYVEKPRLWWPWTMSDDPGYLYALQITVTISGSGVEDMYRLPVGIRTVQVTGSQFLINGKPFYFLGFGKHEDAHVRGKALDYPMIVKDLNLMKWMGANSFRTSHYPYAEELMELCDQHGFVVVDEAPAVGLIFPENFAEETLQHHKEVMHELVQRDKNRPSVVMWSVANEPSSDLTVAEPYFRTIADLTHTLDPTRPVTFACNKLYNTDLAAKYMDVIAINRYYGWYNASGHTEVIHSLLSIDLNNWYSTHGKPMLITEYGAGSIAGMHEGPPAMFTEDYQVDLLLKHFDVWDEYRTKFLVGEMVWAFADFQTWEAIWRVDGNKKGMLTRARQPKAAAWVLRQHYLAVGQGREMCYERQSENYHCMRVRYN